MRFIRYTPIGKMKKLIVDGRGTGKTKQLLEYAAANNVVVLTQNAEALRVKARAYDLRNVEIYDVRSFDLEPQLLKGKKVVFHNLDRMLEGFCGFYECGFEGGTLTNDT